MALSTRRMYQIFQTMTCRQDDGRMGPPESYSEEEKKFYLDIEKEYLECKKTGKKVDFYFPNDNDWD